MYCHLRTHKPVKKYINLVIEAVTKFCYIPIMKGRLSCNRKFYFTWGFSIGLSFREKDVGLSLDGSESYDTLWVSLGDGLEEQLGGCCSKFRGIRLDSPSQTHVTFTQQSCVGQFAMVHGYCWQTWSSGRRWPPGCLELEGTALEGSRGASCGHP